MKHWSFFDSNTGQISSKRFSGSEHMLEKNIPAGYEPIEGQFDPLSQRVDIATLQVVDYQPPPPSPDHEWNTDTKRYRLRPEVAGRLRQHQAALARILELEAAQDRPSRELLLNPGDPVALQKLSELNEEIITLRADLIPETPRGGS